LPNFFKTSRATVTADVSKSMHLYRLLDFVEVPSPFSGTERWYNGGFFEGPVSATPTPPPDWYWAPFNKLSRFRDPGRININTIFDYAIWDAVVAQFPGMRTEATFRDFIARSRRGEPFATGGNWWDKHQYLPSRFANPFRTADSADLMPNATTAEFRLRLDRPIDATLLRPTPSAVGGANPGFGNTPLFQPQWNTATTDNYHNTDRNPYFRFQGLQKLGNILSTTSNCFAVWITIGYFEVEENRPATGPMANQIVYDAAHPDGYALGQEAGIDSGHVTRHRAFFVIDRSIPVGFSPGSRLNTDECVLIRRLIE
jgi:hypothetical protein